MTRLTKNIKLPLVLAAAGLAALAAPGVAGASTVSVSNSVLTYTAVPSEANHVTVWDYYGYRVVQDTGVPSITVSGTTCTSYSPQIVYCPVASVPSVVIHLGNGGSYARSYLLHAPATIYAGSGNDTLIAGGGNDTLIGGSGTDNFQGGSGDNTINSRNGKADTVSCGAGTDTVTADPGDTVAADCESVDTGAVAVSTGGQPTDGGSTGDGSSTTPSGTDTPPTLAPIVVSPAPTTVTRSNYVPVTVSCPPASTGCEGVITLSLDVPAASGHKVAAARRQKLVLGRSRHFKLAAGKSGAIPVRLSRRGTRIFRARGGAKRSLKLTASVTLRTSAGTQTVTSTVLVHAARRQPPRARRAGGKRR
jgi:hypothetical protein